MPYHIAIDATSALAQGGGIGRFTRGLLRGLMAQGTPHRYTLATMRGLHDNSLATPANFRWHTLPLTEKQSVWLWHRLRVPLPVELLLGELPNLYHSPDYTLPPLLRARGVVTIHDLSFESMPEVHEPRLRRYLQRAVPPSIARADHVFADSKSTRDEILALYGTDPAKITVVYPGVEPRFRAFDPTDPTDAAALREVRARYKLEQPFVLDVATLEPRKNLATLIRAFARYRAQRGHDPAVQLVLAGGGGWLGQREQLEELVTRLGLEEVVRFLGFVPDALLPALINAARVLAYPSLYEGFGLPVLEGLACGVPVITARNSSLPEAGGSAARYIDDARDEAALATALAEVLHDEETRARMVQAGLAHAAPFTWAATARQVVGLYEKISSM